MEGYLGCERSIANSGSRKLWLCWETPEGKTIPPYIALCRAAIEHSCGDLDIQVVTPKNLAKFLPDLHPNIHRVTRDSETGIPSLAIKTGFIRTLLLAKYGGLYMDIDALPMASLIPFFAAIQDHGFVAVRRTSAPGRHISIGLLGARPGNPVVSAYAGALEKTLAERFLYKWGEVGAHTLSPIVAQHADSCLILPEEVAHPIVAERQYLFMSKTAEPEDIFTDKTRITMLFHRPFSGPSRAVPEMNLKAAPEGWLHDWTVEDLYTGDILLSKLLRRALPEAAFARSLDRMNALVNSSDMEIWKH